MKRIFLVVFLSVLASLSRSSTTDIAVLDSSSNAFVRSGTNRVVDPEIATKVYKSKAEHEDKLFAVTFDKDGLGMFYGTTDLFDHAREGYRVGFFAIPAQQLKRDSVTVSFVISLCQDDVYSEPQYPTKQHGQPYVNAKPLLKPYQNRCFSAFVSGKVTADSLVLSVDHTDILAPESEPRFLDRLTLYALPLSIN